MSQRDEIATIVVEALKAWTDGGPEPSNAIADALLAAGLLVPPGLTAEKLRAIADGIEDNMAEGNGYHMDWLRDWASFLDTQESPR